MQLSEEDRFVIKTKAHDELLNEIEAIDAALSQPAEPPIEEVEAILACLGDDAALLREKNPECEIAANMDQAVALIRLLLAIPAADFGLSQPASEDAWLKDAVRLVGNYGTAHRKDVKLATDETCNIAAQTTRELLDHLRARTAKEQNNG